MVDEERRWVVDSIEDGVAALEEDGARMLYVPAWLLPGAAREGDVLRVSRRDEGAAAALRIEVDTAATKEALGRSREQVSRLSRNDPGGDLVI
ncbi:MAG TPA: DUF3006 domain-containing protein [Longimicrobium sp.]|jgi:hypothetical protein|nr:DUF3006 domain-containing protein [Longimicrobium sp.]